jgi:hemoglobin/transferrin/lactoferrin receptor protein
MMKLKILWICLWFWGLVPTAFSQVLTVKDSETGKPLEGTVIKTIMPRQMVLTNKQGQASIHLFEDLPDMIISRIGYQTLTLSYEEIKNKGFVVLMDFSFEEYDGVVVTGSRWPQSLRSSPVKVTSIRREDMELLNPQTAADLLGASGEVFIQKSQQGGGSPMIRGFSANRLLYAVDGVRMNNAIFRSGNVHQVISIDPLMVDNAEVLFGPGSVLYGSDAIGGVMGFQTLLPSLSDSGDVRISGSAFSRYASANSEHTFHANASVSWEKWALLTAWSRYDYGHLQMGSKGREEYLKPFIVQRVDQLDRVLDNPNPAVQNPTAYQQQNWMQKIRYRPNPQWDMVYAFHYSGISGFSRYDRLIVTQANGLPAAAVWNYGPQIWWMNHATITHQPRQSWKLYDQWSIRLAQQYFQESRIDRRFQHHRLRTQQEEVDAYSLNMDFEKTLGKHHFSYGVEAVWNDVRSQAHALDIRTGTPIAVADRYPNSTWFSRGVYIHYRYQWSPQWQFQAGMRANDFQIQSDFSRHLSFYPLDITETRNEHASLIGNMAIVYQPDNTWKIGFQSGSGFRAPNVDDIGKLFDFVDGDVVVPNAGLRSEYAYHAECNVNKTIGKYVLLDFSGYATYLDRAMVRRPFQVGGEDSMMFGDVMSKVYAIQNAAFGFVSGFNAGLQLRLPYGIGVISKYQYQRGIEEMDNGSLSPSRHAAPAFGVTRLQYEKNKTKMECYVVYSAAVPFARLNEEERQKPMIYATDTRGNPFSPSWFTLNIKMTTVIYRMLIFSAGVENITNQRYRPYSSGLVAPGRNGVLSLRVHF